MQIKRFFMILAALSFYSTILIASNACINEIDQRNHEDIYLFLYDCNLHDSDMPAVISYLSAHPGINYLDLTGNLIGPEGAKLLAGNVLVKHLNLDNNHIGEEGAEALAQNANIVALSLRNNSIHSRGAIALARSSTLLMLAVSHNKIAPDGITALAHNNSINYLDIAQNKLNSAAVKALANNKNISGLDVSYTNISQDDILALIRKRTNLIMFGGEGLDINIKVIDVLSLLSSLEELYLADNDIHSYDLLDLMLLPKLNILDISNNFIDDDGLIILAEKKQNYTMLLANTNNIGNKGAFALAESTTKNSIVDLSYNHIGPSGIAALRHSKAIGLLSVIGNDGTTMAAAPNFKTHCLQNKSITCQSFIKSILK